MMLNTNATRSLPMPTPHNPNNTHYIAQYKANNPRRGVSAVRGLTNDEPVKGSIAFISEPPYYPEHNSEHPYYSYNTNEYPNDFAQADKYFNNLVQAHIDTYNTHKYPNDPVQSDKDTYCVPQLPNTPVDNTSFTLIDELPKR